MKRILITGVTGFVGQQLCSYLSKRSACKIFGTAHRAHPSSPPCSLLPMDLTNPKEVNAVIREIRPHEVYHLAAQSLSSISFEKEAETMRVNAHGTIALLKALCRYAKSAKVLFVSSSHVYGKTFRNFSKVTEMDLIWPENPYAVSKAAAELACLNFYSSFGLQIVIARSFNHMGPGQKSSLVFSDWCRQIARAERGLAAPVLQIGNVSIERDFMHVGDVVRAYERLLERGKPGEIYNICSDRILPLKTYLDFLLKQSRVPLKVQVIASKIRREEPKIISGSPDKIFALGWRPTHSVFEAIEGLLDEWRLRVSAAPKKAGFVKIRS